MTAPQAALDADDLAGEPTSTAKPFFIDLPGAQVHACDCGDGPLILVLPGLVDSARAVCARVSKALPRHRIVAVELPGLGASPATAGGTIEEIASTVNAVTAALGPVAGCIAFDLSIPVALASSISRSLARRLVLVGFEKGRWLAQHLPDCGDFELDAQGCYLLRLWAHVRDIDMLESIEPRRPRGLGLYKTAGELDETFMGFAVQPPRYAQLWSRATSAMRALTRQHIGLGTLLERLDDASQETFGGPSVQIGGNELAAPFTPLIRRGYEDISAGRIHYRSAGAGNSCVITLVPGAFSSSLLTPLMTALSGHHRVVAPDYIGQGDSERLPDDTTIARTAVTIDELTRKLGWSRYSIYGTQTGAGVALEAAIAFPERVERVVIDSCSMQHASERVEHRLRYFPTVTPDVWGSHVFQVWNVLKDGEVFWPWYRPVAASAKERTSPGLGRLHDSVICTLRSRTTPVYKSMSSYEARNRLSLVHQPVLFVTGPKDIFKSYMPEAERLAPPNFRFMDVPATVWAAKAEPDNVARTCQIFDDFFRRGAE